MGLPASPLAEGEPYLFFFLVEKADFTLSGSAVEESERYLWSFFFSGVHFTTVFTTVLWLRVSHIFWVLFLQWSPCLRLYYWLYYWLGLAFTTVFFFLCGVPLA